MFNKQCSMFNFQVKRNAALVEHCLLSIEY